MQDSWRFFIQFYTSFFHLRNLSLLVLFHLNNNSIQNSMTDEEILKKIGINVKDLRVAQNI